VFTIIDIEYIIKQNGDSRIPKNPKEGLIDLDNLSRKMVDNLWREIGQMSR
jgi:hypothetical protein